jgi:pyruvate dehydrogenase E2 component (dihydrolipoamide acetyltransferase)
MKVFDLPDLGEGLHEAEIVAWHVAVGDRVVADQPLVSVETDKAVVEVPAPFGGRIAKLYAEPGATVVVGRPLAGFEAADAVDRGTVAGQLPSESAPEVAETPPPAGRIKATPAVRALARKLGVDLGGVSPTGLDGQITAADVRGAAETLSAMEAAEPLRGIRRAMASRMAQAHREVVPATVCDEADIDGWTAGSDLTIRMVEAIVAACRAVPALNAWFESQSESLRVLSRIDLGIAVDTPDGLLVPVLRDVGRRDRADLRRGLDALKRDAEARQIPPDELRGATITLSNFGALGVGRFAELVIVPPQVAIVGAGRTAAKVMMIDGAPAARRSLPLSLTFDHRVVNGGEAARFLKAMMEDLARPD